jgi:hypothetical protein
VVPEQKRAEARRRDAGRQTGADAVPVERLWLNFRFLVGLVGLARRGFRRRLGRCRIGRRPLRWRVPPDARVRLPPRSRRGVRLARARRDRACRRAPAPRRPRGSPDGRGSPSGRGCDGTSPRRNNTKHMWETPCRCRPQRRRRNRRHRHDGRLETRREGFPRRARSGLPVDRARTRFLRRAAKEVYATESRFSRDRRGLRPIDLIQRGRRKISTGAKSVQKSVPV